MSASASRLPQCSSKLCHNTPVGGCHHHMRVTKLWNRREISVSSCYDQSHYLHPHPYHHASDRGCVCALHSVAVHHPKSQCVRACSPLARRSSRHSASIRSCTLPRAFPLRYFMTRTRSMWANPSQNGRTQYGNARSPRLELRHPLLHALLAGRVPPLAPPLARPRSLGRRGCSATHPSCCSSQLLLLLLLL
jgi:hypothetical protein